VQLLDGLRDPDELRAELARTIANVEIEQLSSDGARSDFEHLCSSGCNPTILMLLLSLFRSRTMIESLWSSLTGPYDQRLATCRALDEAAAEMERAFPLALNESAIFQLLLARRVLPSTMAAELRMYSRTLRLAGLIGADLRARSMDDVSKMILAAYVERVTGTDRHASIAGILTEVADKPDYTADAQRQWRYRNKAVLDDPSSLPCVIANYLADVTEALKLTT
jgi:hypothetical protein